MAIVQREGEVRITTVVASAVVVGTAGVGGLTQNLLL